MMKPEIILIRAKGRDDAGRCVPWGIINLASYLGKYGHKVRIIDRMSGYCSLDRIMREVSSSNISYIGISAMTTQAADAEFLSKYFKRRGKKVILGGLHYTICPEEGLKFADYVFKGESERSLLGFLENSPKGRVNESEPLLNLDDIPLPQEELFKGIFLNKNYFNIMTSRGCPYNCSFCLNKKYTFNKLRYHCASYIGDLLEMLNTAFGLTSFFIADDIFTINKQRALEICSEIKKRGLKIKLGAFTHAGIDDLELYKEMKDSGFESLSIGVESGADEVLKAMDKQQTVRQTRRTIEIIKKAGLRAGATFMVGNILETEESLKATLELVKGLGVMGWVSYAQPFPGTKLSEICSQYGRIINHNPRTYWNDRMTFIPNGISRFKLKYYRDKIAIALKAPVSLSIKLLNKIY